jgi:hypothetical protein
VKNIWVVHGKEEGSQEEGAQEKGSAQEKTSQEESSQETTMCCENQGRQKM